MQESCWQRRCLPVQAAAERSQALVQEVGGQGRRQIGVHLDVDLRVTSGQALLCATKRL